MKRRWGLVVACLATAAILAPLGWLWWNSLIPAQYSVTEMGYADYGGGPTASDMAGMHHDAVSIDTLTVGTDRPADVEYELTARQERFTLASGRSVDGYTLNGESPGPVIRATQGDLVEVTVTNDSVPDGITLHWHGVDMPNAMDGVAGVTQDAVMEGESFTYRFLADQVGTYWYHSHQVSHEQVIGGLFGTLVVDPPPGGSSTTAADVDKVAVVHIYGGVRTVNGEEGDVPVEAQPGDLVRVRVVNTDNGPMSVWTSGAPYRVVAVDGYDLNEPDPVAGQATTVTAGGRADLEVEVPASGVRIELGGNAALLIGPGAEAVPATEAPREFVDFLTYGASQPLPFDPADADRHFEYNVDRRPGFLDGRPGLWWTINGHLYPDVPMFTVAEGDIVVMRISNTSGDVHPMHLHGHHAVVLSRDGEDATGSPWWVDSLNVLDGETYEIAFLADNPGVWLDHCHNLPHAKQGLLAHLMYEGFTTPFVMGGEAHNEPE
ncbi:MAG: multicopper oxidase family protein [Actinomycetota bacterium]|nr:multicopper oxidase family protein [Actinomycetota bacterium]